MEVKKIVLTGGPCAGKTTALSRIPEYFERLGWKVITLSEGATLLILGGILPETFEEPWRFQQLLLKHQLTYERNIESYCSFLRLEKILIVCDRGACDGRAYVDETTWNNLVNAMSLSHENLRDQYDAVFHLVTAADGAEEFYTLANNAARQEGTIAQARFADQATQNAWVGHPHLRIIPNNCSFDQKMERLITEIAAFLGEPEPFEIERKFLIRRPDTDMLVRLPNCQKVDILQVYLNANQQSEMRIRQRGTENGYTFTKTTKYATDDALKRIEVEERISESEFVELLMLADPDFSPLRKERYCLMDREHSQYLEIDIYPGENDYAILEAELSDVNASITFPDFIDICHEVTYDKRYRNSAIAKNGGRLPAVFV